MKNYKIIKYQNGLNKDFYCVKKRKYFIFWKYLKFTKTIQLTLFGNLSTEAYVFDTYDRAKNLINKIKNEGIVNINGKIVKK